MGVTSLWNYKCTNCCYQTWSNWQTKVYYSWQLWPMIETSTAFGADYRYADQRTCMNGDMADYFAGRPSYNVQPRDCISSLDTILWDASVFITLAVVQRRLTWGRSITSITSERAGKERLKTRWPSVN